MENYIQVGPWRIEPLKDVLMFLHILQQVPPEKQPRPRKDDRAMIN